MYNLHTTRPFKPTFDSTKDTIDHEQAKASQFKAINILLRQLL